MNTCRAASEGLSIGAHVSVECSTTTTTTQSRDGFDRVLGHYDRGEIVTLTLSPHAQGVLLPAILPAFPEGPPDCSLTVLFLLTCDVTPIVRLAATTGTPPECCHASPEEKQYRRLRDFVLRRINITTRSYSCRQRGVRKVETIIIICTCDSDLDADHAISLEISKRRSGKRVDVCRISSNVRCRFRLAQTNGVCIAFAASLIC